MLRVQFGLGEHFSCTKSLDMLGNGALVGSLWNHEERDTCPQTLAHTVHAAMGDEESSAFQELKLRYKRLDNEIAGYGSQASNVDLAANRHDDASVEIRKCLEAEAIEISFVVKNGPKRNVNHRLVPQLVKRERWSIRASANERSDKLVTLIE